MEDSPKKEPREVSAVEMLDFRNRFDNEQKKVFSEGLLKLFKSCVGDRKRLSGTSREKKRQFERWLDSHKVNTLQEVTPEPMDTEGLSNTNYFYTFTPYYATVIKTTIFYDEANLEFKLTAEKITRDEVPLNLRAKMLQVAK